MCISILKTTAGKTPSKQTAPVLQRATIVYLQTTTRSETTPEFWTGEEQRAVQEEHTLDLNQSPFCCCLIALRCDHTGIVEYPEWGGTHRDHY